MDKAAILAPGPSIALSKNKEFDYRIAVNRASHFNTNIDVVSVYNNFNYDNVFPKNYNPLILTPESQWARKKFYRPKIFYNDIWLPSDELGKWVTRSSLYAAIFMAVHYKASNITIFGVDWDGSKDWDGFETSVNKKDRTPVNYETQKKQLRLIKDFLEEKGIVVNRIQEA